VPYAADPSGPHRLLPIHLYSRHPFPSNAGHALHLTRDTNFTNSRIQGKVFCNQRGSTSPKYCNKTSRTKGRLLRATNTKDAVSYDEGARRDLSQLQVLIRQAFSDMTDHPDTHQLS
jgi:hypothetical protein